ncbi:helix-turn-helix domain-containing protein [Agrococcus casei]|uniref:Helix-turn-helix domain-containing protein n=1 Tax=Agrococcus casei LMG 22410 TaxID=1255656 RepID=A0A1R4GFL5_9MICO|nr:helix-turn-helix domain-containing protein [Agrococcus casei]SJM66893.1 hypothetical protein CZ674_11555 [Agrococcus casei LMG 22410]
MTNNDLTTSQVAERLGVTRQLVLWMVRQGRLAPTQKLPASNGTYLFAEADVATLEQERSA